MTRIMGSTPAAEYDYVVVGAGSAGCVVAARLAENRRHSVLLLEAGGDDRNPWIHIPLGYGKLFNDARHNWMYETLEEPGLGNRKLYQPRGKVLGGTSSINGMVYTRGQAADYDHWRDLGNPGWGYRDVLPWFKKSEHQARGADEFHGVDGPLWVSDQPESHLLADAFLAAARECGLPVNRDINGVRQDGATYLQTNTRRGMRCSSTVYLKGAPSNLQVATRAVATRVEFENRRASGVRFTQGGSVRTVRARKEIILCGGVFNTPKLLQLSGVGPGEHLQSCSIPVVHHLPGVGANLHDHFRATLVFECTKPITHNDSLRGWHRRGLAGVRYLLTRKGPVATGMPASGFFRSMPGLEGPDIQVTLITSSLARRDAKGVELHGFSGFTMSAVVLQPLSRGSVRIRSADPGAMPEIQFNYLTQPQDWDAVLRGIALVRQLAGAPSLSGYVEREHAPGPRVDGREALEDYVRRTGGSGFHAVGTCAMGTGAEAVVDHRLRVHGIDRLRIADASVMPRVTSGNTHAPTVMIAERAADFCLRDALREDSADSNLSMETFR